MNEAVERIKAIHAEGPKLRKFDGTVLAKGDVPGHEFHGNQYGDHISAMDQAVKATDVAASSFSRTGIKSDAVAGQRNYIARTSNTAYKQDAESARSSLKEQGYKQVAKTSTETRHEHPDGRLAVVTHLSGKNAKGVTVTSYSAIK